MQELKLDYKEELSATNNRLFADALALADKPTQTVYIRNWLPAVLLGASMASFSTLLYIAFFG